MALSGDGKTLYVAERGAGSVAVIDTAKGAVSARIAVGRWPVAVALAEKTKRLYVCNQDDHTVTVIDLGQSPAKPITQIPAVREPIAAAVTPDERHVVVTNLLPHGVATDPALAAEVNIIDASKLANVASVKLPAGSTSVYGVCVSPEGKWAYVVHSLGRFNLPLTQLERGWTNTYALSVIDIAQAERFVTLLLDDLTQGAANPHAVTCSSDGQRLWISHAGVHEVSVVEIGRVHELLGGKVPEDLASLKDGTLPNIWVRIREDPQRIDELQNDLTALYIAGVISRVPSGGNGPRGLALSPGGKTLLVANYYSGSVAVLDTGTGDLLQTISLGPQRATDAARSGEVLFHDATLSFQRWQSCATCHPNQARVDGLRWDFLRDGLGNAKDTPSLLLVHKTEPLNRRIIPGAVRESARAGAKSGVRHSHMVEPTEAEVDQLLAYFVSLQPEPSPLLTPDGKLTEAAQRGKALFEGKADCAECHPAPYYTDRQVHNLGIESFNEPNDQYDTPSLIECYRTAPYLHDGRALTLEDVLTKHDPEGRHGDVQTLSERELDDLVAFLLSL